MDAMKLVETAGGGLGGEALAAGLGGLVGSWFGNGFGGGWNGDRGHMVQPLVAPAPAPVPPIVINTPDYGASASADLGVAAAIMASDKVNSIDDQLGALGLTLVQGQGQNALTACQGFNGVNQAIYQASSAQMNASNQAAAGLNTAIVTQGYESRLSSAEIARAISDCCCSTQKAVAAEGAATRQLIQNNLITQLQTELCDSKANAAYLRSSLDFQTSQAAQTRQLEYAIANA